MAKTKTTKYDVTEHLRTLRKWPPTLRPALRRRKMTPHLLPKLLGILLALRACHKLHGRLVYPARVFIKLSRENERLVLIQS